jgi:DNA (cytosine-5)-methyltransferase 1
MATFIDLFAGCGGLSSGLRSAGLIPLAEVEVDAWACETLRANFPDGKVIEADIRQIDDETISSFAGVDVIAGGPPCQGFSVAGSTQYGINDPRNELVFWFLHWVEILRPRVVLIENVPGMLSRSRDEQTLLDAIRHELEPIGYTVTAKILNAAEFGVPQSRRRAIIAAVLDGAPFPFPSATHGPSDLGDQTDLFGELQQFTTVGEALTDLPSIDAGEGSDDAQPYASEALSDYQARLRSDATGVFNHVAMKHTRRLIERFSIIKPGQSLKDVPLTHGQRTNLTGKTSDKPFKYNNYRLDPSKPSLTIPASFQSLFLHPVKNRNLTAREAARLMGFSDSFVFMGKRTTMSWEKHLSQYNQIGNAVCPPMAEALGAAAMSVLRQPSQVASPAVARSTRKHILQSVGHLPKPQTQLSVDAVKDLRERAADLGEHCAYFKKASFTIPSAALPLALCLATAKQCPVCSPDSAPYGCHSGDFLYLISKEDCESLRVNEQDHGLDYHLRTLLGIDHQVAHLVGERLAELGRVDEVQILNERTGRKVRGFEVRKAEMDYCDDHPSIMHAVRECFSSELSVQLPAMPL